jgi:ribose/xylose/arabinose/galactoside ABC-type transport system permease subunit
VADAYFYLWETAVSLAVIICIAVYTVTDRLKRRLETLPEQERARAAKRLDAVSILVLGGFAAAGGCGWILFAMTGELFLSPSLEGWHAWAPGLATAALGLFLLCTGLGRYFARKQQPRK